MKRDINLQQMCKMKIYYEMNRCYSLETRNIEEFLTNDYEVDLIQRIRKLNLPNKLKEDIIHQMNLIEDEYFTTVIEPTIEYD